MCTLFEEKLMCAHLMPHSFEPPKVKITKLPRARTESELSVQMDPNDIERFTHPQTSEIYTVVQKPLKDRPKQEETPSQPEDRVSSHKPLPKAPTKSTRNVLNDSLFSFLDKSDRKLRDVSPSHPNVGVKSARKSVPPRPALPSIPGGRKVNRPLPKLPASRWVCTTLKEHRMSH